MIKEHFLQLFFFIKRTLNAEKRIKKENKPILNEYKKRISKIKREITR